MMSDEWQNWGEVIKAILIENVVYTGPWKQRANWREICSHEMCILMGETGMKPVGKLVVMAWVLSRGVFVFT